MVIVKIWLINTILLILVKVVYTLNNSITINEVNVIVTISTKESSNIVKAKNIITAPWYMDFHTQIKNVL